MAVFHLFNRLRHTWHRSFEVYRAQDSVSAEIRAKHLQAVVRLAPFTMGANLVNGIIVCLGLGAAGVQGGSLLWLASLALLCGFGLQAWWRRRERRLETVPPRAMLRVMWHSVALASAWAALALLWFPDAAPRQQLLIATVMTGMMAGGGLVLASVPAAAIGWVAVTGVGSTLALLITGDPLNALVATLLVVYSATVVLAVLMSSRLFTARLRSEREAARQSQVVGLLLRDFEEHSSAVLWELDRRGRLMHVSSRLAAVIGLPEEMLAGQPLLGVLQALGGEGGQDGTRALQATLDLDKPFRDLVICVPGVAGEDGGAAERWWSITAKPVLDELGHNIGWRGVISDVSREQQAHQRLAHLAHFDSLTGLANRVQLRERLAQVVAASVADPGERGALLCLDVDNFKTINDSLGHSVGDAVLQVVARRLQSFVREGDVVARMGGDEFAMVLSDVRAESDVAMLGQRLLRALDAPCEVVGHTVSVGASIGVAMLPEHGRTLDEALGNADLALYAAKAEGRGRCEFFAPALSERNRRRLVLEQELRRALARDELALHWQPQVDIATWTVCGAEALLRWNHPQLGAIGPEEFIPVAEDCGLICDFGVWVLERACIEAATCLPDIVISVNASSVQLVRTDFVKAVERALARSGLPAHRLEIEITESAFMEAAPVAMANLHGLKRLGVRIALDDFGTGYSSLAYLRRFPFDSLKIDRAFVRELSERGDARAIVRTILQLARTLGMSTIAEGVEEPAQLEVLRYAGCHAMQGFLAARPMAVEELGSVMLHWRAEARPVTTEVLPDTVYAPLVPLSARG